MSLYFSSLSDVGRKRKLNEDSVFAELVDDPQSPIETVLMVADGMGGHHAGELASREAENTIKQLFVYGDYRKFAQKTGLNPGDLKQVLHDTIFYIDGKIKKMASDSCGDKGMGTTITVALILKSNAGYRDVLIGHVGDSRVYLISSSNYKLLTADDSLVWKYYSRGMITFDEMRTHPEKNVITQALGVDTLETPQVFLVRIKEDDILLLCSDGLHGMLTDKQIFQIGKSSKDPEIICKLLIEYANKAGGKDNVSAAVFSRSFKKGGSKKQSNRIPIIASSVVAFIVIFIVMIVMVSNGVDAPPELTPDPPVPSDQVYYNWKDFTLTKTPDKTIVNTNEEINFTIYIPGKGETVYEYKVLIGDEKKGPFLYNDKKKFQVKFSNEGTDRRVDVTVMKHGKGDSLHTKTEHFTVVREELQPLPALVFRSEGRRIFLDEKQFDRFQNDIRTINWGYNIVNFKRIHKYTKSGDLPDQVTVTFRDNRSKTYKVNKK